jgi:radical SAM superfamily enzyme YgiQ (UPF0313 family)
MDKIILVQPSDPPGMRILRDHMGRFGVKSFKYDLLPPLDLAYSASLLEKNGFEVEILDCAASGLKKSKAIKKILKKSSDLIIVNTSGISASDDLDFAHQLKNSTNAFIGVIGPYINHYPENVFSKKIDVVISGEVEYTILELANEIPLDKIKGISFKNNDKIIKNPSRELITNLDELPFPAYHLLPMKKYSYWYLPEMPFTTFQSSRGCSFKCIYCPYSLDSNSVWRGRSAENVLSELKLLKEKYKIESILFRDQIFTLDMKRAEEICNGISKEGLDFEWRCETRADCLSKNLMVKMKDAGCVGVHMGVESGDQNLSKNIAKVGLSLDRVREVFNYAREIDLGTRAFFIIGLPGETKETIQRTLEFARELKANDYFFNSATPFPGTKLYEIAEKEGWITDKNWEKFVVEEAVMRNESLTEDEIKCFTQAANKEFGGMKINDIQTILNRRSLEVALSEPKLAAIYIWKNILKSVARVAHL